MLVREILRSGDIQEDIINYFTFLDLPKDVVLRGIAKFDHELQIQLSPIKVLDVGVAISFIMDDSGKGIERVLLKNGQGVYLNIYSLDDEIERIVERAVQLVRNIEKGKMGSLSKYLEG